MPPSTPRLKPLAAAREQPEAYAPRRIDRLAGLLTSTLVRSWMGTLDYRAVYADRTVDPTSGQFSGPVIAVFWHDSLLVPFYLQGRSETVILTSQHRDANWVAATADYLGFQTVRGSTYRGGQRALLRLVRNLRGRNIGIACDGPRGPRHRVAQGPIYLSAKLGIPLVCYGIGFAQCWKMRTWDRFVVPRPYSRVRMMFGHRIQIPGRLTRQSLEANREEVEDHLVALTAEAQSWAESGARRARQLPLARRPMPREVRRRLRTAA